MGLRLRFRLSLRLQVRGKLGYYLRLHDFPFMSDIDVTIVYGLHFSQVTERIRWLRSWSLSWGWDRGWCLIYKRLRALILAGSMGDRLVRAMRLVRSHSGGMGCLLVSGSRLLRLVSIISLLRVNVSRLLASLCLSMGCMGCNRLLVSGWGVGYMSTCSLLCVASMSGRRLLQKAKNTTSVSAMLLQR